MAFVGVLIVVLELTHVVTNVLPEDVVPVNFSVELVALSVKARESLGAAIAEIKTQNVDARSQENLQKTMWTEKCASEVP